MLVNSAVDGLNFCRALVSLSMYFTIIQGFIQSNLVLIMSYWLTGRETPS